MLHTYIEHLKDENNIFYLENDITAVYLYNLTHSKMDKINVHFPVGTYTHDFLRLKKAMIAKFRNLMLFFVIQIKLSTCYCDK